MRDVRGGTDLTRRTRVYFSHPRTGSRLVFTMRRPKPNCRGSLQARFLRVNAPKWAI